METLTTKIYELNMTPDNDPVKIRMSKGSTDYEVRIRLCFENGSLDNSNLSGCDLMGINADGDEISTRMTQYHGDDDGMTYTILPRNETSDNGFLITKVTGIGVYRVRLGFSGSSSDEHIYLYSPLLYIIVE